MRKGVGVGFPPFLKGGEQHPPFLGKKNSRMKIFKFSIEERSYNLKKWESIGYSQIVENLLKKVENDISISSFLVYSWDWLS